MPSNNQFRHQRYESPRLSANVELLRAPLPTAPDAADFRHRLTQVGNCLRAANVAGIYLIHGTFVGADTWGVIRKVARWAPGLGKQLRQLHKQLVDHLADDLGNYPQGFAEILEDGLSGNGTRRIPVRLLHWSSENHHIGRADGVIRLLDDLATQELRRGDRWLFWGHSHGGNLLALLSNLLAASGATRRRFFTAAQPYFRWPIWGRMDLPAWSRIQRALEGSGRPWDGVAMDLVTFGTPVRYGWDQGGYSKLLHIIHHRPIPQLPVHQARFPPTADELLYATGGDLMQWMGIAGTNFAPSLWAWRAWLADRRLNSLLQPGEQKRDLLKRLRCGRRIHEDGLNLLVDYGLSDGHIGQHLAGHAVYTRRRWMLFHAEEIARRLYVAKPDHENRSNRPGDTTGSVDPPCHDGLDQGDHQ